MLQLSPRGTYCKELSGKLVSASVTGPDRGTDMQDMKNGPNLIGDVTETSVYVGGIETTALLDTGSCISSLGNSFYQEHLSHLPLKPISDLLKVECADGQNLPYTGYIETNITCPGIPKCSEQCCLLLIVPDTNYNLKVPLLIGTNILNELINDCKKQHGEQYLQTAKLHTPWYLSMRCIAIREKELRRNKNRLAVIKSAETNKITIGPNQSITIAGYLDKKLPYNVTCAIIQEASDSSLPDYVDVTPAVIHYNHKEHTEVFVNLSNLTTNSVTISPRTILCEVQPASVDESVFEKLESETEKRIFEDIHIEEDLTLDQSEQVKSLLRKHMDIFSKHEADIGDCDRIKHRIDLSDDTPFKQRHRRIPPSMVDEVRKHIEELLSSGIIRKSKSPWASNVVLVRKKNGKLRMCVDYRMLNKKTIKDSYALPRIEEVFDILNGSTLFSTIDMKSGYHQVTVEESHKSRTAFTVGPLGFYEYNKMPFGLSNSPATYQRLMEECLGDLNMKICVIYLDDLIIFSNSFEQHLERLDIVLTRLQQCNLKLSAEKCFFLKKKVKFLGHIVSGQGVETDPEKTEKIRNWPRPVNSDELRSFLAFAGYYRRFVKDFSKITKPLTDLLPPTMTKKNTKPKVTKNWQWEKEHEDTFNRIKMILSSPPILAYPDFQAPFELHTDASGKGIGAILYQTQEGQKKVIAYASRSLSKSEKNYSAFKLEFLALKWAVTEKFSDYLLNNQFVVYTDNNPLTHILSSAKLDATGQRWVSALGQYNFTIIYRAGLNNKDADVMSRYPFDKLTEGNDNSIMIDDKTVKMICNTLQVDALIETIPSASVNILDAAESPGQPMSQIEQREIRKSQRDDALLGKWVRATIDRKLPRNCFFSKEDLLLKKTFHSLKMIRGILYREITLGEDTVLQLVLPKVYHKTVLQGLHNDVGHPGKERTISLIRERFYWPKMSADIEKWVTECERCLRRKSSTNNRAPLVNIVTNYPLELVCMDYLTLEPSKGCGNILVITDHFTKYALAVATKNQTAKTTAEALYDNFMVHYGIPVRIHSDQGANFESEIIKELCKLTGMTKSRTSPYHAMGNPIPERFNSTLLNMLGTLEPEKKKDWKKYLPALTYAYNCTRHETTKISPYELLFGRKPKLPIDSLFETPVKEGSSQTTQEYIRELKQRMKTAQDVVNKVTDKAREKMKTLYDKKAKAAKLEIGDKVLVRILRYDGKHKIADKFEADIYEVTNQQDEDIPVFEVKSPNGLVKKLHRNHLYLLGFMDNETQSEDKNKVEDEKNQINRNKDSATTTLTERDNLQADVNVVKDEEECGTTETRDIKQEDKDSESDDDADIEYVSHAYTTEDAREYRSHERPVIEEEAAELNVEILGPSSTQYNIPKTSEQESVENPDIHDIEVKIVSSPKNGELETRGDYTETEGTRASQKETETSTVNDDETGIKSVSVPSVTDQGSAEGAVGNEVDRNLRRSARERKPPKWFDSYQVNQVTVNRPVNRKLQTLQMLLSSGVLNELDSDMTDSILVTVMK